MTIGKLKYIWERLRGYLGIISLLLAWRMNVLLSPFEWYWYAIGGVGSLIVIYLDMKYVVSDENSMGFKKNAEFQEMKKMIEEIRERIKHL